MNGKSKEAVGKVKYTKAADGRYRVVNALGEVKFYSAIDFLTLYAPVATVRSSNEYYNEDIGKWAEDTAGPFEKSDADSLYPINKSQKKILSPDTIANLVQSNLENNPNGYSMDALSRTMFNRK